MSWGYACMIPKVQPSCGRSVPVIFNNACKDRDMQQRPIIAKDTEGNAWHLKYEPAAGSLAAKNYRRPTKRQKSNARLEARRSGASVGLHQRLCRLDLVAVLA